MAALHSVGIKKWMTQVGSLLTKLLPYLYTCFHLSIFIGCIAYSEWLLYLKFIGQPSHVLEKRGSNLEPNFSDEDRMFPLDQRCFDIVQWESGIKYLPSSKTAHHRLQRFPVPIFPIPVPRLSQSRTRFRFRFRDRTCLELDSDSGSETEHT